ncbi:N-acetylmuramoyl-L-alanine amidase, partial [Corynebacterium sanguinis]|nr:N-acetylmuramoyl-L-alanine amidase [Corynebacterium sanguinis]
NNLLLREIRYQLTGSTELGQFPGLPQSGGRTLYDLASAIAEIEGVPNTRDTL